jgi:Type VI secretion system VasI, EvfG, VC_A0118
MRALLIGALAATLVGCSCLLPPQANIEGCTDASGLACFDRSAASQPVRLMPASFKTDSATAEIKSASEKRMTAGTSVPAPRPKANNKDRSNHAETVQRGDTEKTASAPSTAPAPSNESTVGSAQKQLADTAWIVSETTSPVDYAPLTTAVINATSSVKDAPNALAVRCHQARTELLLRTEGAWRVTHASEVQVDYRINDQPVVRLPWTVSPDGTTASYKGDAVGFLRSLPEGARLTVSVLDHQGLGQEATFQLTGVDSVRKKIGLACNWPPTARG